MTVAGKRHVATVLEWMNYSWTYGGDLFDESGKPAINSTANVDALDYEKEITEFAPSGYTSATWDETTADLQQGLAAQAITWRLRAASASAKVTKEHFNAIKDADLMTLLEVTPGGLVTLLTKLNARTKGRFDPFANVVVSNVPGPRKPLYLGQWSIERWFSTGQLAHGANLNLTVWSYADQFNLCVLADAAVVSDPWEFVEGFRESLAELQDLAAGARPVDESEAAVPEPTPTTPGER